jgi:hypothetical protein
MTTMTMILCRILASCTESLLHVAGNLGLACLQRLESVVDAVVVSMWLMDWLVLDMAKLEQGGAEATAH